MANITILTRLNTKSEKPLTYALKQHNHTVGISTLYDYSYSGRILEIDISPYSRYPQETILWQVPDSVFPAVEELYKTIESDQNFFNTSEAVSLTVNKMKRYKVLTAHNIPTIFVSPAIPGSNISSDWAACKNYGGHEEEKVFGYDGMKLDQNITDPWVTIPAFHSSNPVRVTVLNGEIICGEILETTNGFTYAFKASASEQEIKNVGETALYTMKALGLNLASLTICSRMQTVINVETSILGRRQKMELLGHAIGRTLPI